MSFDISEITTLAQVVAADPKLQQEFWSEAVKADASDLNPLKDFVGEENSGMPIVKKRDAKVTGGQKVYFSTHAPVRGRGVMGAAELKSKVGRVRYNAYSVTVDLRRFAISEEQLIAYFSLPGNADKNRDDFLFGLCKDWWGRTQVDDFQFVLRDKALFASGQPNVLRIGNGADFNAITVDDTYSTRVITDARNTLSGLGASALKYGTTTAGAKIPQFLHFAPTKFLDPLEDEQKYREALLNNQKRDGDSYWWTGDIPMWKNNLIFNHDLVEDSGANRQGSPLAPMARLGLAIPSAASVDITGGGAHNSDAALTDTTLYDFFAYFRGYYWKTYELESAPSDTNDYYAIIYNVTGADRGKYEIIKYAAAANTGNKLTAASVTREADEVGVTQKTILTAASRYTAVHPSGSLIIPCNKYGVPLMYGLVMGAEALLIGSGDLDADPIEWNDDFKSKRTGVAHINAQGIQSIIGYSPAEDTLGRRPNYLLVEGAADFPELDLVDIRAAL
jgi:hypothetical protein